MTQPEKQSPHTLASPDPVGFWEAFRFWLKLGFVSFGGPAGQIAIMHQELVEKRRWLSEQRFLHALNYCMLLPGPEAQQLATYIGWLMHRTGGGHRRRRSVRTAVVVATDSFELDLYGLWASDRNCRRALRHQASGDGHRHFCRV
jgi:hypothetical protein